MPRRPLMLVLVVGLVAVGASWAMVVQTMSDAKPASAPGGASAIVWANRVFDSQAQLRRWLRSRGAAYVVWKRRYPAAAAVLERRAPPAPTGARAAPADHPAEHAVAAASTPSPPHGYFRVVILGLLAAIAAGCAAAAAMPRPVLVRFPGVARAVVPHRQLLFAGAAALAVGLLVGAVLT